MKSLIRFTSFIIVFFVLAPTFLKAQTPIPEGRRLRDIVADKYPEGNLLIGATTGSWGLNEPIGEIMDREFSYVTPENDFKQSVVRADPNSWNWSRADAWLQHITDNNQVLRIHGPISPQCSRWAKEDNRTAEELSQELDTFMTALCMRYNGVEGIEYLDVVNEISLSDGSWHHPKTGTDQWENPWLKIGQDTDPNQTPLYIKQAFAIANEHAPDLKQIINNHCHPGTEGMEKVKETALYLRESGYRIDGIGWQAHVEVGWATEENLQHLRDIIDWCQQRNLEFHVTEFDAWIFNKYTQTLEGQAYTYKAIMDVLLEKLDTLTIGWNTWHITDASGWKTERIPSLFDDNYQPKPAYYAFQLALETKGDYSSQHEIIFNVKHEETGEILDTFNIIFNQDTLDVTDQNALFQQISPARYTVHVMKKHFNTLVKKHINVYSDTTITLYIHPAEYNVTFKLNEENTTNAISAASIQLDTLQDLTGLDGTTTFLMQPGMYDAAISKEGYSPLETTINVSSDTVITLSLAHTHGDIKIQTKKNDQPVNNVLVILENDSVYSNALGIASFSFLPLGNTYNFKAEKEGFKSQSGSIQLEKDTSVVLNLDPLFVNVNLIIESSVQLTDFTAIMNEDSIQIDEQGKARFYEIPVDLNQYYEVLYKDEAVIQDSFFVQTDTTLQLSYVPTHVSDPERSTDVKVYPNPAGEFLHIQSKDILFGVKIFNSNGQLIRNIYPSKPYIKIDLIDMKPGNYWVQTLSGNDKIIITQPIILQ